MKLLTLSKFTDITESLPSNNHTDSQDIFTYNQFLKEPIQLKHFIACGSDGLPMSEPKYYYAFINNHAKDDWSMDIVQNIHLYKKALQDVIFEGWEVEKTSLSGKSFIIKNTNLYLHFEGDFNGIYKITYSSSPYSRNWQIVHTYTHLANQTINNPIQFK